MANDAPLACPARTRNSRLVIGMAGIIVRAVEAVAHGVPALMKRLSFEEGAGDGEDSDKLVREEPWLAGVLVPSVTGRIATGPQEEHTLITGAVEMPWVSTQFDAESWMQGGWNCQTLLVERFLER